MLVKTSTIALAFAAVTSLTSITVDAWYDVAKAYLVCEDFRGTFTFKLDYLNGDKKKYETIAEYKVDYLVNKSESYMWHIHENPVAADDLTSDCTSVGGHFNPTGIVKGTKCDPNNPAKTCEMGDLAGVYGNITGSKLTGSFKTNSLGLYDPTKLAKAGTSIVVHNSSGKKICCGTINLIKDGKGKCIPPKKY
ncbi:Superoxide dismutase [Mycoemilia scoparia]|uniref:Superoxide dismutase n=1 Tax=Mycoemilia scoparia TaxID=417184 RepID=A0A9W8A5H3_9FUNG|nr:Superoxide dismutase [Mycoemilia scoparia]